MVDNLKLRIKAHVIEATTGKMIAMPTLYHCPRVGEELRTSENVYWSVVQIVHVLDEDDSPYTRVNIGVNKI
jgi:hypothetical protein